VHRPSRLAAWSSNVPGTFPAAAPTLHQALAAYTCEEGPFTDASPPVPLTHLYSIEKDKE
jgi:hypothetical protein